jgi:hypothetical protein
MDCNLKKHSSLWHERHEVLVALNIKFMVPVLRINLELEATGSSTVFVPISQPTWHHIQDKHNPNVA